jgi:UDP-N-acetylmuramyl pentapeptide synthase
MIAMLKNIITSLLIWQARKVITKYKPTIVVVGGDVGKTTTKDAIYTVLSTLGDTRKSKDSFNSEIGLPLTILDRPTGWRNPRIWLGTLWAGLKLITTTQPYPKRLVLELGDRKPGDTALLSAWLPIDVLVITKIDPTPTHIEFFASTTEHRREKQVLMESVRPGGHIVINNDDTLAKKLLDTAELRPDVETHTFGQQQSLPRPDLGIKQVLVESVQGDVRTSAMLVLGNTTKTLTISGHLGNGVILAASSALLVGAIFGVSSEDSLRAFREHPNLPKGRLRTIPGVNGSLLIDDTYNAGPASMRLALDTIASLPKVQRRIALLGGMLELGDASPKEHRSVGGYAVGKVDMLVTVGSEAKRIASAAKEAGFDAKNIYSFSTAREAGKFVEHMAQPGDAILIKGSQGFRMERATQELMLHPEKRSQLLVRQESYWLKKS